MSLFISVLVASIIRAATVAQMLAADSTLSKVSALASQNPAWSTAGQISVFAPTNGAISASSGSLPSGTTGVVTSDTYLPLSATYSYVSTNGVPIFVFNNANPGTTANPNIEIRYALAGGSISRILQAENGIIYVSDNVVMGPPPKISAALVALGCNKFQSLISSAGLTNFIDGLNGVTIFAPTDAALDNAQGRMSTLSSAQLRAYILFAVLNDT